MALSYKSRRRWSVVLLLVGLPLYIAAAVFIIDLFDRPSIFIELMVYLVLGILWAIPFKFVFLGVGKDDPDQN